MIGGEGSGTVTVEPELVEPREPATTRSPSTPEPTVVPSELIDDSEGAMPTTVLTTGSAGGPGVTVGSVGGLYPGHRVELGVTYVNPYSFPIAIDTVNVAATGTDRCSARYLRAARRLACVSLRVRRSTPPSKWDAPDRARRLSGRAVRGQRPGDGGAAVRSPLVLIAAAVATLVVLQPQAASAAWAATGSGNAPAGATYMHRAAAPTATQVGSSVNLSWAAVTLDEGTPATGYTVLRHSGIGVVTPICTTVEPTRSCTDTAPVQGAVQYGVVATFRSWTGQESPLTPFVSICCHR